MVCATDHKMLHIIIWKKKSYWCMFPISKLTDLLVNSIIIIPSSKTQWHWFKIIIETYHIHNILQGNCWDSKILILQENETLQSSKEVTRFHWNAEVFIQGLRIQRVKFQIHHSWWLLNCNDFGTKCSSKWSTIKAWKF